MMLSLGFQTDGLLADILLGSCWHSVKLVTESSAAGLRVKNEGFKMPGGQTRVLDAFSNDRQCLDTSIPAFHLHILSRHPALDKIY